MYLQIAYDGSKGRLQRQICPRARHSWSTTRPNHSQPAVLYNIEESRLLLPSPPPPTRPPPARPRQGRHNLHSYKMKRAGCRPVSGRRSPLPRTPGRRSRSCARVRGGCNTSHEKNGRGGTTNPPCRWSDVSTSFEEGKGTPRPAKAH